MALNLTQQDVQRSIFEAIRLVCVAEGYTPDITTLLNNQTGWDNALKQITTLKGFAIEIFSSSSNQAKGIKKVPRITIHPKRIVPGDVGLDKYQGVVRKKPTDPDKLIRFHPPFDLFNAHFEIHLVSNTGEQDVILNAILFAAIGTRKFLPLYNDSTQVFFLYQTDYFDTADSLEGVNEKITTYEVPDLMLGLEEEIETPLINEIDVDIQTGDDPDAIENIHVENP